MQTTPGGTGRSALAGGAAQRRRRTAASSARAGQKKIKKARSNDLEMRSMAVLEKCLEVMSQRQALQQKYLLLVNSLLVGYLLKSSAKNDIPVTDLQRLSAIQKELESSVNDTQH
eukprot:TRINITY_DN16733_c0_g1_i1.p1 TRINITY_DN16733_c0_g1~~TRINITY_DN16733_c0_g1_i1.p1  ORF type:complete len:115 (+),score=32.34 TRINITY_DN16733_c0_g1_i1:271-615(+)